MGIQGRLPAGQSFALSSPSSTCGSVRQRPTLGAPVADCANLKRGDLVFWKGHVAVVRDAESLLHANAFHMAVAIEPVAEAVTRIRAAGGEVSAVRRITAVV